MNKCYMYMGKFWISNDFVRKHARYLSGSAQRVYMALSCHVNKDALTFIGQRTIAEYLNMSKTTVNKAIKELEVYQLLVRLKNDRLYQIKLLPVPDDAAKVYQLEVHKEGIKENYKEEEKEYKGREQMLETLEKKFPGVYKQLINKKKYVNE